jgi:peroxiredoxin
VSAFFLFSIAIGDQKLADDAIQVGATIPAFTATDEHGHTFDSQSLAGHPVLIKFFRAHW